MKIKRECTTLMTEQQSKQIGRAEILKTLFVAVLIAELYWMINETRGDFANGILFYLDYHANIFMLSFYLILFGSAYFFGQNAGREIILLNKSSFKTAIKYSLLSTGIIASFAGVVTAINKANVFYIILLALVILIPITLVWLGLQDK